MSPNLEQVRKRAYELWLGDGMAQGRDIDYWCAAERELLQPADDEPRYAASAPARPTAKKARGTGKKKK